MQTKHYFLLIAALLFTSVVFGAEPAKPFGFHKVDSSMQAGLEQQLQQLGLEKAIKRKKLAVTVVDITDISTPRLASVNGDHMMYAASMPKIAILLGAFERIDHGDMELDSDNRDQLTRMIRYSSNQAATTMLNRVGKEYLANLLQSPRYALYDEDRNGGLWVGKEYGKAPAWKRDPLHNISHGATAIQAARFYYLLESGQMVSPELTKEMKEMLSNPGINHKFVKGLKRTHPGSKIFRKSGSWRQYHADSAIIEHDGRRYIAVAIAEDAKGGEWMSKLIVKLDDLVFETADSKVALLN